MIYFLFDLKGFADFLNFEKCSCWKALKILIRHVIPNVKSLTMHAYWRQHLVAFCCLSFSARISRFWWDVIWLVTEITHSVNGHIDSSANVLSTVVQAVEIKISYLPHSVESPIWWHPFSIGWGWGVFHALCWTAVGCGWGINSVCIGITYACCVPRSVQVTIKIYETNTVLKIIM